MSNFTDANLTDAVIARLADCPDPRFKQVMTALIRHAHDFMREVQLTEAEWMAGINFLTATGQKCDEHRQEFILLSDVLGISMMAVALNHKKPKGETEPTVLGPFYLEGAPDIANGAVISGKTPGLRATLRGRVLGAGRKPIEGAVLDVWQAASNGLYSMQDPKQDLYNLRGRLHSDADGKYWFHTIMPHSYPIPVDGPVGDLLRAMGRPWIRPGHVHFIVSAPGYETLTTHLFDSKDPHLDSDPVFGVKSSLIVDFKPKPGGQEVEVEYDFIMKPAA
jgi:hydroxyquinol 1,2-dioxygenase